MLLKIRSMATNFSPCKGSCVLNRFPSNVTFGMNGFHVSASGAIQGHHGPLVTIVLVISRVIQDFHTAWILYFINTHFDASVRRFLKTSWEKKKLLISSNFSFSHLLALLNMKCSWWAFVIAQCPSSVVRRVVHNFFKHFLLLNHGASLDETWQGCFLGEALPKLFKRLNSSH